MLQLSHWGEAWKQGGTGAGDRSVEAAGLGRGLQEGTGDRGGMGVGGGGETTFGDSCISTLEQPGIGIQVGQQASGASRRHDSKMPQRLAMASTWDILAGGTAPVRAPVTT